MTEKKEYRKAFCILCLNREFSLKNGVLCGITNALPDFDYECSDFNLNKSKLKEKVNVFKKATEEKYENIEEKRFGSENSFFIEREKVHKDLRKFRNKGVGLKFKKKKFSVLDSFLIYLGISAMLIYGNIKHNMGWTFESLNFIGFVAASIIAIIYILYNYFNDSEYIITVNENYISLNGLVLFWNNILDYGVIKGKSEEKVIISTILNGIQTIDLKKFDITSSDLITILDANRKTFYNKVYN